MKIIKFFFLNLISYSEIVFKSSKNIKKLKINEIVTVFWELKSLIVFFVIYSL